MLKISESLTDLWSIAVLTHANGVFLHHLIQRHVCVCAQLESVTDVSEKAAENVLDSSVQT